MGVVLSSYDTLTTTAGISVGLEEERRSHIPCADSDTRAEVGSETLGRTKAKERWLRRYATILK